MGFLKEFLVFIKKQAWSALFGGLMLFFIVATRYFEIPGVYRYDLLFVIAVLIQIALIAFKLERPREVIAIIIFHILAMLMEIYKTHPAIGSWVYPEPAILAVMTVPLFSGFMYSAVGSYIARSWRINNFVFKDLPKKSILVLFALAIYANFFTNHFVYDVRYILFGLLLVAFWKTKFYVTLTHRQFQIHPLFTNALLAFFIWLAEQVSTFARIWVYPNQALAWKPVSFHMFTSWYMLLIFSFIIIALLQPKHTENHA